MDSTVKSTLIIRPARVSDAPAMGRMMVESYLQAHKGQIPDSAWQQRQQEWTWEVSAGAWGRTIAEIEAGSSPKDCIFLAVDVASGEAQELVAGLVMGGTAECGPWAAGGEIYALYIDHAYHRRGLGRKLVQAAVRHLNHWGMDQLVIRSLVANEPANRFYASLGGKVVGYQEREEYGFPVLEQIFGWEDSSQLLDGEV